MTSEHFTGANVKTAAKLLILEWYLEEYTTIMENNWGDYWYVDTHAGTGKTETTSGTLIDGSAIRALENHSDEFDRFYFYELDEDHFHTLHETLSDRFGYDFDVYPYSGEGDTSVTIARCDDPYIRIMQMDSNDGVSFLAENANSDSHWFTFIDPKGLTAKKSTLDTLIDRGNMDILINYQTTGVMRSAAEAADHAHGAVSRTLGDDDWPKNATKDDYVRLFKERLEENEEWKPVLTKNMESPSDASYRFDLVFATANNTGRKIMRYIMEDRDDLWEQANEELGQLGLGSF